MRMTRDTVTVMKSASVGRSEISAFTLQRRAGVGPADLSGVARAKDLMPLGIAPAPALVTRAPPATRHGLLASTGYTPPARLRG